MSKKRLYYYKS